MLLSAIKVYVVAYQELFESAINRLSRIWQNSTQLKLLALLIALMDIPACELILLLLLILETKSIVRILCLLNHNTLLSMLSYQVLLLLLLIFLEE